MTDGPIQNREELGTTRARALALDCVEAGIEAAHPRRAVRSSVSLDDDELTVGGRTYELSGYDELLLVGGGKAAGPVARGLADVLGERLSGGTLVTTDPVSVPGVVSCEGGHPVPTEGGVAGAHRVLELADRADEGTLLLVALTGGGSALLTAPAEGIDLADIRAVTSAMLTAGAAVHGINAVRKHVSALKGGALARRAAPATVCTLLVSDVVGDDPGVVASGPTAPDDSTYADARDVLARHSIDAPAAVRDRLDAGVAGEVPETPGPGDPVFDRVTTHRLADGMTAIKAARETAASAGYQTLVLSSRLRGEAREVATVHAGVAEGCHATGTPVEPPAVLLSGGEVTVTVGGDGVGGPNTEFALASALELTTGGTTVAAVDTDGIDGCADAAGGLVDAGTVTDAREARAALAANDTASYLRERAGAVHTGPTGTTVNDLRVVVLTEGG